MAEKINILTVYNICREMVLQAEKSAKENGGKVNPSLLPPLAEAFEKIIEFIKGYLITAYDPFMGTALIALETNIDFKVRAPLDINVKKDPMILKFNPMFIIKYKFPNFLALIISEILRIVYDHPTNYAKINTQKDKLTHELLERSSSISVSGIVQNDVRLDRKNVDRRLVLPEDVYTANDASNDTGKTPKSNSSMEYYYKFLDAFLDKTKLSQQMISVPSIGKEKSQQLGDPNQPATENNNNGSNSHQWEDLDKDDTSEKIKDFVASVYESIPEKTRGNIAGSIIEQIQKLLKKPEISWKQVLRKYIGVVPADHYPTRLRVDRRQPYRSDLRGKLSNRHVELIIAIDTSGSMSNSDISYVINEIFNIVKDYKTKITIIECDSQIGKIYNPKKITDVQTRVTGRGGTSFVPVIKHINETGAYKNALLVYFTDGYGDSEIPKPRTLRNLWVVLQDEKLLSLKEPYGEVKALHKDEDWIKQNGGN